MGRKVLVISALALVLGIAHAPTDGTMPEAGERTTVAELTGRGLWDVMACSLCLAEAGASVVSGSGSIVLALATAGGGWLPGACSGVCIPTL